MHRAAVFVDVGYLLACGGALCLGTDVIAAVACDYGSLAKALETYVIEDAGLPLLRSYWYDGAGVDGVSAELRKLAGLPRAKLRLGVRGWEGQKEVDILLHDDVVGLAASGLVASIYLLSGDGDFRPTVARAQTLGVEVVLLDIPVGRASQSLVREADRHLELADSFWRPFFTRVRTAQEGREQIGSTASAGQDAYESAVTQAGADFAYMWLKGASLAEIARLKQQGHWRIPPELDGDLIRSAERATSLLREHPELKACARAGFWLALESASA